MIKYHFKKEKNKTKELLTMKPEKIYEKNYEELSTYEQLLIDIQERDEIIEKQKITIKQKENQIKQKRNQIKKEKIIKDLKNN